MKKKKDTSTIPYAEAAPAVENPKLARMLVDLRTQRERAAKALKTLPTLREVADGYIITVARLCPTKAECSRVLGVTHVTLSKRLKNLGVTSFPVKRGKVSLS